MIQIEILDQGLGCLVENLVAVNAEVVVMPVREGEDFDRAMPPAKRRLDMYVFYTMDTEFS